MKKSLLLMVGTAVLLASCAKSEMNDVPNPVTGDVAIQLRSTHYTLNAEAASSRAPYTGTISEENPLTALILSSTTSADYSEGKLHTNGTMKFVGGTESSSYDQNTVGEKAFFPDKENDLFLFGLHPCEGWDAASTSTKFTFAGKEDVMVAAQVSTNPTKVIANNIASLTFKHLLTKLEISLKAKSNGADGFWGKVTKIELLKANGEELKNIVEVTLNDAGASKFSGNNSGVGFPFYGMSKSEEGVPNYTETTFADQSASLTTTETPAAYSMVAPFTADGTDDLLFKVYTTNAPTGREVSVGLKTEDGITAFNGTTEGRAFSIVFNFAAAEDVIVASASVIDWVYSGKTTVEIE